MNYRNKVLALSSVLAVLLLIYAAGIVFAPGRRAARVEAGRLLSGSGSDVASLEIGGAAGETSLKFAKESGSWSLLDSGQSLPVLDSRIQSFITAIAAVNRLSPRSDGSGALTGFGLDAGKSRRVVVKGTNGKVLSDFELGGYGPTGSEVYLRIGGKAPIYATDAGIAAYVEAGRSSWLNLKVFAAPIKPDEVESVAVDARLALGGVGKPLTTASWMATRKDGGWSGSGAPFEAVLVETVLRSILNMEGQDISAFPPRDAFEPVRGRIELGLGSGAKRAIEIGKDAGAERFYVRTQGSPYVYLVSAYSLANVAKPMDNLVKK